MFDLPLRSHRRQFVAGLSLAALSGSALSLRASGQESPGGLTMLTDSPVNAQPDLQRLVTSHLTPNELFYIRSHAPAPKLPLDRFQLQVQGLVRRPLTLSLAELQTRFPHHEVEATLTCAGNRRDEHSAVKQVKGVPWGSGAIGNAIWKGVSLADVLRSAEVLPSARYVWFEGLDEIPRDEGTIPFGGSIPLSKAMAVRNGTPDSLLAFGMNGKPLPLDHGYPLRSLIAGYIGARSVKWLGRVVVSDTPSNNHYVQRAYKIVTEDDRGMWNAAEPILQYPINSVTCTPARDAVLRAGKLSVAGYALPTGKYNHTVAKVELSLDGGKSWQPAALTSPAKTFCWRLWKAELEVTPQHTELLVRATDSGGNQQPPEIAWNLKGYLFNAWHRTPLKVN